MIEWLAALYQSVVATLLWMSVVAALVALFIMILRRILKGRVSHQALCLLWLLVFVRLFLPFTIETPFSLIPSPITNAVQQNFEMEELSNESMTAPDDTPSAVDPETPQVSSAPVVSMPVVDWPQAPAASAPVTQAPQQSAPVLRPSSPSVTEDAAQEDPVEAPVLTKAQQKAQLRQAIAAGIWLVGAAAMLVSGVVSYLMLRRRVYDSIRIADGVWEHPDLSSPFILGLFRPRVYLPMGISGQARQFILQHEQAHLHRLDHIVKPVCWLALAFHWFNPFVWGAFQLMGRDIENACDERVIRNLGSEVKADYAATLLALATKKRFPAPSPLSFDEGDAEARVKNVLHFKKPVLWVSIGAVVIVLMAAVCLLSNRSPRSLDSYYPQVNWGKVESAKASFRLSDYPMDYDQIELTDEETAEVIDLLCGYKYWKGLSHLIPDNRIGWYDLLWRLHFDFENGSGITLTYSESGTLVVYYSSGLLPDGSILNRTIHYSVDEAEKLTQAILAVIDRQVEQTYTTDLRAAMKNADVYSEEFSFLLASLIPPSVEFSLADPLTADDCAAIFSQSMWLSDSDNLLEEIPYNTGSEYNIPLYYMDILLPEILIGYARNINWNEYSGRYIDHSDRIALISNPIDQREFLQFSTVEDITRYSDTELAMLMDKLGLSYENAEAYDITILFSYSGNVPVRCTYCILFIDGSFKIVSASFESENAESEPFTPVFPGYTTEPNYPGVYFKTEYNSLDKKTITAYHLVGSKLEPICSYQENSAHNYVVLSNADNGRQTLFTTSEKAYEAFADLLAEALGPDWTPPNTQEAPEENNDPSAAFTQYETPSNPVILRNTDPISFDIDGDGEVENILVDWTNVGGALYDLLTVQDKTEDGTVETFNLNTYTFPSNMVSEYAITLTPNKDDQTVTISSTYGYRSQIPVDSNAFDPGVNLELRNAGYSELLWDGMLYLRKTVYIGYRSEQAPATGFVSVGIAQLTFGVSLQDGDFSAQLRGIAPWCKDIGSFPAELLSVSLTPYNEAEMTLLAWDLQNGRYLFRHNETGEYILRSGNFLEVVDNLSVKNYVGFAGNPDQNGDGMDDFLLYYHVGSGTSVDIHAMMGWWVDNGQLKSEIYDWRDLAADFNANNTLTYDADTNSCTLSWNGATYNTGPLANDLSSFLGLEDGFSGAAVLTGDQVYYRFFSPNSLVITLPITIARGSDGYFDAEGFWRGNGERSHTYPLSIDATGLYVTWTIEFTGNSFRLEYAPAITGAIASEPVTTSRNLTLISQHMDGFHQLLVHTDGTLYMEQYGSGYHRGKVIYLDEPMKYNGSHAEIIGRDGGWVKLSIGTGAESPMELFVHWDDESSSWIGISLAQVDSINEQTGSLFRSVLQNNDRFTNFTPYSAQRKQESVTLDEAVNVVSDLRITKISAVDLDGDDIDEVLLSLDSSIPFGTQILHFNKEDGKIYGYMLWIRGFHQVKTDGTFYYSGSASDSGIARLIFTAEGYEMERITYTEFESATNRVNYYVNREPSIGAAYDEAIQRWESTEELEWLEYTTANVETLLSTRFPDS